MKNLDTYNRVNALESRPHRQLLYGCLLIAFLGTAAGISSYWLEERWWPQLLLVSLSALGLCLGIIWFQAQRAPHCQFCGSALSRIVQPLRLTERLLEMRGVKQGAYFFTRKAGGIPGTEQWVKLSNQSLVCHHCRLMETTIRLTEEPASAEEIAELVKAHPTAKSNTT